MNKCIPLQSEINSIRQDVMDSGWDLDQKYIPEKWEWTDLNSKAIDLKHKYKGFRTKNVGNRYT